MSTVLVACLAGFVDYYVQNPSDAAFSCVRMTQEMNQASVPTANGKLESAPTQPLSGREAG